MAYNNYFPATYQNGNYYRMNDPYYQQIQQAQAQAQAQMQMQNQQQQTIQQSGFVLVRSEQEARAYPVAPGNSVTFKDETSPYCYVKTMGFNQLDRPTFERYRLVKEESTETAINAPITNENAGATNNTSYATKDDLNEIWSEIETLKNKIKTPTEKAHVSPKKVIEMEIEEDDE